MTDNMEIQKIPKEKRTKSLGTTSTSKKKRGKSISLDRKKARAGWIFIMPFIIGFIFIYLPIIYNSLRQSMGLIGVDQATGAQTYTFKGFEFYISIFTEKFNGGQFGQILIEGLLDMILDIPMILLFSLFMAVMLNQKMIGRAAFRAILFVPVILASGFMVGFTGDGSGMGGIDTGAGSVDAATGESSGGGSEGLVSATDLEWLFANMAIGDGMLQYVTDAVNRIYDIVNRSGVQILIFLAGLQSISPAIYESVQIDGASSWETFWKITFPMISPMILVNAVYTVIDSFTGETTVMKFINTAELATQDATFGLIDSMKVAMSWVYFLIVVAILALIVLVCSAYVFYQKKN